VSSVSVGPYIHIHTPASGQILSAQELSNISFSILHAASAQSSARIQLHIGESVEPDTLVSIPNYLVPIDSANHGWFMWKVRVPAAIARTNLPFRIHIISNNDESISGSSAEFKINPE
jgi:hypothetical protein